MSEISEIYDLKFMEECSYEEERQKFIDQTKKSRRFKYDFTVLSKKIIIEYNHIDFHPHPDQMDCELFKTFKVPLSKEDAISKYEYDIKKQRVAEQNGYKVYIVWSHLNFEEQLQNIKKILREKDSI